MTRGQRRTHVRIWIALAVALPVVIAAGLWARRSSGGAEPGAAITGSNP